MRKSLPVLVVCLVGTFIVFSAASCKKQNVKDLPQKFNSKIDGVAVSPLPRIDIELADRIIKDGEFKPLADVTDAEALASATTAPTTSTSTPGVLPEGGVEMPTFGDFSAEDESTDPNDL